MPKTVEKRRQRGVGGQAAPQLEPEGGPDEGRLAAERASSTVSHAALQGRIRKGGAERYHQKNLETGKLFARERLAKLLDPGSFVEDGLEANAVDAELPADGVITGLGRIHGRPVGVMANDSTVKAGSWGKLTVEKIVRIQELALRLLRSARLPGRLRREPASPTRSRCSPVGAGVGCIFFNECQLSGLGAADSTPASAPGRRRGSAIPAFRDLSGDGFEGNAFDVPGSPRMAEMVIGEKVSLEEMGGARMHCTVSGCGDVLVKSETEALEFGRRYLAYFPQSCGEVTPTGAAKEPENDKAIDAILPVDQNRPFDIKELLNALLDGGSQTEIKALYAGEIVTTLGRLGGRAIGVIASQPKVKGGVLFPESSNKAARFIQLCNAFNLPLLYLADVPGFMIGTKVERAGIIRAGAKMVQAVSLATVPRISVTLRKAYGAGLYAMDGPGFLPDAALALPQAMIAVMGPEAAVNAVYYNKIQEKPEPERAAYVEKLRAEYRADIDILRLASELVVDAVIPGAHLRDELIERFAFYAERYTPPATRKSALVPM